jgi:flavin reductase (DIM6/NTAB) family NADH-FMN oxidoreductase RutF
MTEKFKPLDVFDLNENVFKIMEKDWMLVTAGITSDFNTMTAAWGGLGILWRKAVAFVFIRPQRYTFEFAEKYDRLTLSFYDEKYRSQLNLCGSRSGQNTDKVKECGFTCLETPGGGVCFNESRLYLGCRKLYFNDIEKSNIFGSEIHRLYPADDYHRMYICEITGCYSSC